MRGFAPRKYPASGLQPGLHRKTTFCFSASTCRQDSHARHFATAGKLLYGHSRQTPSRPDSLQSTTLSGRLLLLSRRQPVTAFRRISFHTNPHSLTPVSNLHSDLTGKRIHSLILFSFFSFFFFISLCTKKRKPAKPISISFSCNPKFSPNLVQASPSQSLSLLFSPSNQYILPHRPRSGHT